MKENRVRGEGSKWKKMGQKEKAEEEKKGERGMISALYLLFLLNLRTNLRCKCYCHLTNKET